jgi:hypothetical protein
VKLVREKVIGRRRDAGSGAPAAGGDGPSPEPLEMGGAHSSCAIVTVCLCIITKG